MAEKSLMEKFYDWPGEKRKGIFPSDKAEAIVFAVIDKLTGRKGFDGEWDECDEDIQEEILEDLCKTVRSIIG